MVVARLIKVDLPSVLSFVPDSRNLNPNEHEMRYLACRDYAPNYLQRFVAWSRESDYIEPKPVSLGD